MIEKVLVNIDRIIGNIVTIFLMGCFMFLFSFFQSRLSSAIVAVWDFDFKEWFYSLKATGELYLFLASIVFILIIISVSDIMEIIAKTRLLWLLSTVFCVCFAIISGIFFVNFVTKHCFVNEYYYTLESIFFTIYNDADTAKIWISSIILILLLFKMIVTKLCIFVVSPQKSFLLNQASKTLNSIDIQISIFLSAFLMWPCMKTVVITLGFDSIIPWIIIIMIFIIYNSGKALVNYWELSHYLSKDTMSGKAIVMINEMDGKNAIYYNKLAFSSPFNDVLKNAGITLIPYEYDGTTSLNGRYISVDIIDIVYVLSKKRDMEKDWSERRGAFRFAYIIDSSIETLKSDGYDGVFDNKEDLANAIYMVSERIDFQVQKRKIFSAVKLENCTSNCIVNELLYFKEYMVKTSNFNLIFDSLIKWTETINYFFSLILIQALCISVNEIRDDIQEATFGKWRNIRHQLLSLKSRSLKKYLGRSNSAPEFYAKYKAMVEMPIDSEARECLLFIEKALGIQSHMSEDNPSISVLLQNLNRIRDYTRGHGVFTFEVSPEINLSMIRILASLVNCLIQFNGISINEKLMEELGWFFIYENGVYFCYSYSETGEIENRGEYSFSSFSRGNTISVLEESGEA